MCRLLLSTVFHYYFIFIFLHHDQSPLCEVITVGASSVCAVFLFLFHFDGQGCQKTKFCVLVTFVHICGDCQAWFSFVKL